MTSKQITAVALKCLAIYLLFTAVVTLPMWIVFAKQIADIGDHSLQSMAMVAVIVIITSGIAIFFAYLAWRLANRIVQQVSAPPVDNIHVNITPRRLEEILFRVLGVYLAVTRISPFVLAVVRSQLMKDSKYSIPTFGWEAAISLVVLVFGVFLTFKPGAVIDLLDRITKKSPAPADGPKATLDSTANDESEIPHS